jgi:hypothetical protein
MPAVLIESAAPAAAPVEAPAVELVRSAACPFDATPDAAAATAAAARALVTAAFAALPVPLAAAAFTLIDRDGSEATPEPAPAPAVGLIDREALVAVPTPDAACADAVTAAAPLSLSSLPVLLVPVLNAAIS